MQFLLIAYDGTDSGAFDRRMKSRPEHLEKIAIVKKTGQFLCGGAILDDTGKMIGSMILYEAEDSTALNKLLENEPYIYNNVWGKIEIHPFKMAKIEA
ncbi:MAG: YciI family protein [Bacteroidia bacterium]|nr:YciI family protein [Bacteroidia bacterium]